MGRRRTQCRKKQRCWSGLLLLGWLLIAGVCFESELLPMEAIVAQAAEEEAEKVGLSESKITISKGGKYTLSVTGDYKKVSWKVNRKSIATVSKKGVVTGVKKGTTTVIATVDGVQYKCTVVVDDPKLNVTTLTGVVGDKYTLSVSGTKRSITYSTKNKSIATVTKKGVITFKKAGTTTIYATVGGRKKLACKVTVTEDRFWNLIGTPGERTKREEQLAEKANQIYKELITGKMTDIEKVRAFHDYIVLNTAYDYENLSNGTIPEDSYRIDGVLLHEVAVCQGYAETMQLFLDAVGIENKLIGGSGWSSGAWVSHAWNLVKLDGNWYHVDATWDDPVMNGADIPGYVGYDYFCLSDSVMEKDHRWRSANYPAAEGGEYCTYISDLQLAEYRKNGQVLESIADYEEALLAKLKAGERDISLLYPENQTPDVQAVLQRIANHYYCRVSVDYYQPKPVGDYYLFRMIVTLENE
ncbi:MAG: Ig-like domain-containing protein [Lachnospiraceae bacterium]|nr:Ig-like domain-containing protein [Lachnospiraceae bacterium]